MDKKLIRRIVAVVMTCASISALAFIGCNTKPATPNNPGGSEVETPGEESVSLNKTSASITVGGYVILSASVTPNTVSQTVTWTTSDPNVATVENGYVTGAGVGTATITATSVGGKTATCTVTVTAADSVNVPVTGVTLNNSELTLRPEGTATLVATVAPSTATNKNVTWSSSNTGVATVSNGVVTAVAEGTATITVTTEDGSKTATCAVTVQAADPETPSDYTANGDYVLTFAGDAGIYTSLKADPTSDSGYQTTYFKVATGDYLYANMKLQANKIIKVSGKAIASNKTDSSKNTNLGVSLKSGSTGAVSGLPDPINFAQADGEKAFNFELTVTTEGEIVLAFTRSSGNTGCEITALTITISDAGPVDVESVSLNKTSGSLFVGATETLTATVTPSNATNKDVVWTSSDETVAAVDQNGKVTALKAGTATITATAADDGTKQATCVYTVSKVMPAVITIDREEATIEIDGTIPLIAKVSPDNTTVKTVTWSSSDTSIATVDANGVVTGVSTGSVTITATSTEDSSVKATCTVNVLTEIVRVTSVTLSQTTATINMEDSVYLSLNATVAPDNASNKYVAWTTSDKTIATVDANGKVTARKGGTVVITATADGVSAECKITVEAPAPVAGLPVITVSSEDELETAYLEWTAEDSEGVWFNVYYKAETASEWTQLDGQLVREYADYYRADMVGLKEGTYDMKVVPVIDDTEDTAHTAISNGITVKSHDRTGFAFVNGTSSGAYNEDGTLKSNAKVIYITEQTKDTVSMEVTGADSSPCVGLQSILTGYAKGKENTPLCVRFIGNITDLASMDKGDIVIENKNNATPGITFEGIGADATINGWGIRVKNASNVEVRNLGFMNCDSSEGDCLGLQQKNDHIWAHNNDFFYGDAGSDADQAKGDGSLDTKTSTYVTHSYNHFWDTGKSNLQGMKSETEDNFITYHHNWYDHSDSRHPRIRTCTVHIYNNYFDGNAKYGVGVTMGASAFVEANYFRSTASMKPMLSSMQGTDAQGEGTFSSEAGGIIKSFANVYDCTASNLKLITYQQAGNDSDCYEASSRNEQVPSDYKTVSGGTSYNNFDTASTMYSYTVESAEQAKLSCERYAGRIDGGDFEWQFNNATDDSFYGVDTKLKAALVAYDDGIVKIGGVATGSSGGGSTGGETGGEEGGETGGDTPTEPDTPTVEGEIIYIPSRDGYTGMGGISLSSQSTSNKATEDIYVLGYNVAAKTAAKVDSNQHITLTPSVNATLTLYTLIDNLKVNEEIVTGVVEGDYYVITVALTAGTDYDITKGNGENALFALQLTPVA